MALISKSSIQEINNRLNAIAIVEEYVRLEKKSGRFWGRCPFHSGGQEKTPSFKVDPDLKTYHCFGCGKGGSVISFVMEMDKISYPEALKLIAGKTGVELVYEEGSYGDTEEYDNTQKEQLFELYKRTTGTFTHFLKEKPEGQAALNYLKERGISAEMAERFKLGFAPADRDFLHKFLMSKGYSDDFLQKSGLFSARYKNSCLFSGRLVFPISDSKGRIAAFGGRAMPGAKNSDGSEPPKYINSPETEIYKKGQTLYALDLALGSLRQSKSVYLAEGYMDVIALHQAGITNAVAPLGTAFTGEQASLLRRWADKAVLIFDNDEAGEKAAYKAILTCRKGGLPCEVASVKEGDSKDPADILQKFGPQILNNLLKNTINDIDYLIGRSKSLFEASGSGKNRAAEFLFPYLDALDSEIERDECIARIADSIGVERDALRKDYNRKKTKNYSNVKEEAQKQKQPVRMNNELFLLTAVAVNMALYSQLRAALEIKEIDDPYAKELFIAMEECFVHDESDIDSLLSRITNEELRGFIASRGASQEFKSSDPHKLMEDGINEIRKKRLRKRLTEIGAEIRTYERSAANDDGTAAGFSIEELLAEKKLIDSQMRKLEGR